VLSFSLESTLSPDSQYFFGLGDIPAGGEVDFQIQASIGYYADSSFKTTLSDNAFTGEASEWSSTQTFSFSNDTASPTPTVTPSVTPKDTTTPQGIIGYSTSTVMGMDWVQLASLALLAVIAGALLIIAVTYLRRRSVQGVNR
jgi:hypothetical protein